MDPTVQRPYGVSHMDGRRLLRSPPAALPSLFQILTNNFEHEFHQAISEISANFCHQTPIQFQQIINHNTRTMYGFCRTQGRGASRYNDSYAARPSDYDEEPYSSAFDGGSEFEGGAQGYYSPNEPDFSDAYGSGRRASGSARHGRGRRGMRGAGRMPRSSRNPYGMDGAHFSDGETGSSAAPDHESAGTPYTVEDPEGNIIDSSPGGSEGSTDAGDTTSAGYGAGAYGHGSSRRRRPDVSDYEDTLPRQRGSGMYGETRGNDSYGSAGTRGYGGYTSNDYSSSRGYSSRRRGPESQYSYPEDDAYTGRGASGHGSYRDSAYSGADDDTEYLDNIDFENIGGRRAYDRYGRRR